MGMGPPPFAEGAEAEAPGLTETGPLAEAGGAALAGGAAAVVAAGAGAVGLDDTAEPPQAASRRATRRNRAGRN
ncbi:MAG: hypothetical protein JOZ39_11560, partial [Chloroflexi bacterium]|nr:hypothetical protein [Chloroflexota bacterium]